MLSPSKLILRRSKCYKHYSEFEFKFLNNHTESKSNRKIAYVVLEVRMYHEQYSLDRFLTISYAILSRIRSFRIEYTLHTYDLWNSSCARSLTY